jgi:ubiquinone/menaquinone biosynthesis C-methylase UbiE
MSANARFVGSIPQTYHECLGPMLFAPYAKDFASRLRLAPDMRILEIAAGTGILTEALAWRLPAGAELVATDLNEPMLEMARERVGGRVQWQKADAQDLPFPDASFDLVLCQFGVMFFPDRVLAYREARRVLRPGGRFVFNAWRNLDAHKPMRLLDRTVRESFPDDPPDFYNVPFGYGEREWIEQDLREAGFEEFRVEEVSLHAGSFPPSQLAQGGIFGNPLLIFIQEHGGDPKVTQGRVEAALRAEFGERVPMELHAHHVEAEKA